MNRPRPRVVSIIPEPVMAMTAVLPTRVVGDRIQAKPVKRNSYLNCSFSFVRHIPEPVGAQLVLDTGLGNEHRPLVAFVEVGKDQMGRHIQPVGAFNRTSSRLRPL